MRTRSLIMAAAGAVLAVGVAVPVQAMAASPSPTPVDRAPSAAPGQLPATDTAPDLLRRCLASAVQHKPLAAECASVSSEVRRLMGTIRPAAPQPAVVAKPAFTG